MRTLERPIRWTALLLASGALVGCAGGTMPVSYFHPGGGDIGSRIARQGRQFPGAMSAGAADPGTGTAAVSGGRAVGLTAGNFQGSPAAMGAHATSAGHATAGHASGGGGAAGGHG